jgi:eukaryotic-like serine/threonine-protein kinase
VQKPEVGQIIGGKYRLLRELGRGGMATVFEAENTLTLKRAAVKWLHPQFHEEQQGLQRVIREARASSRIRHDNVVDVYDVAEEGSAVYLVMELLHGEPLSQVLEREQLPIHELVALLVPAMRGVAAAHAAGVVHRDVKPENIFLSREPNQERAVPKVIDFGISKLPDTDPAHATRSGITMGTPRYASYEQLLGARDVDARTDIYAFGVILYEALCGRAPYGEARTFAEQAVCFATQVPARLRALRPEVPEELDDLVQHAIAKQRDDRIATMEDLVLALVPFADPGRYASPISARWHGRGRASLADRALAGELGSPDTQPSTPARRQSLAPQGAETRAPSSRSSESTSDRGGPSVRRAMLLESRRRGLMLTALGVVVMALALLSMRFEDAPRSHAERNAPARVDAGGPSASQAAQLPALQEAVAPVSAPTPSAPPPRPLKQLARKPASAHVAPAQGSAAEPLPASAPPALSGTEESHHRAGQLLRHEF